MLAQREELTSTGPTMIRSAAVKTVIAFGGHRYAISASRSRRVGETSSCVLTIIPAARER